MVPEEGSAPSSPSSFLELAETLENIRLVGGKNQKVQLLAGLLTRMRSSIEVEYAARFAAGRATPKGSVDETQVGYSTLVSILKDISRVSEAELRESWLRHGDLGESMSQFIGRRSEASLLDDDLTLLEVARTFEKIADSKGKGSGSLKRDLLKSLLLRSSPLEAKYIVKILTREMRIGLVEGLVEEAISKAFGQERTVVREAYLIVGDVGLLARAAREGKLEGVQVQLMRPTNFMLAEPMQTAVEIAAYFEKDLLGEYKYDGVRAQVHKRGADVKIFSRRLEEITGSFPEIVREAALIPHDYILDGEVVAFDGGPVSFHLLQRRLRRIEQSSETAKIYVHYFCFDILYLDGKTVYRLPLRERKALLSSPDFQRKTTITGAESRLVRSAEEIGILFTTSRSLGYEGLVVKDPESPYTPGRRGRYWAKLKEELDTLDVVLVAAEYGHGKRAGILSDYTFAVRDRDELKIIGKAYSGLTDKEILEMMKRIEELTVKDEGFRKRVRPEIVLEVAFDSIQRSERHDSGFALRFPRIKRIRDDRAPSDIDTIEAVERIYEAQRVKAR